MIELSNVFKWSLIQFKRVILLLMLFDWWQLQLKILIYQCKHHTQRHTETHIQYTHTHKHTTKTHLNTIKTPTK